jgi:hypothetical protein
MIYMTSQRLDYWKGFRSFGSVPDGPPPGYLDRSVSNLLPIHSIPLAYP